MELGRGGVRQNTTVLYPALLWSTQHVQTSPSFSPHIGRTTYILQSISMHHL